MLLWEPNQLGKEESSWAWDDTKDAIFKMVEYQIWLTCENEGFWKIPDCALTWKGVGFSFGALLVRFIEGMWKKSFSELEEVLNGGVHERGRTSSYHSWYGRMAKWVRMSNENREFWWFFQDFLREEFSGWVDSVRNMGGFYKWWH